MLNVDVHNGRDQGCLQHGEAVVVAPLPSAFRGEGARFSYLKEDIVYSVCTLFTANAPKTAFPSHLGVPGLLNFPLDY